MIRFTQGNLLEADVEAVVNTVNTVGVMGKGIALMFKERFPENFKAYQAASKRGEVKIGRMFVTASAGLSGPRWIINFPTKKHWRNPSRIEWIGEGLKDLRRVMAEKGIRSIAIPPLGSGNGGLDWAAVRPMIEKGLGDIEGVDIVIYEPTAKYQNVVKGRGVEKLTAARALIAEMIRRYGILGLDCSIIEAQKLAWILTRVINRAGLVDPMKLDFEANRYGPYAHRLTHLLNALDGSYLHCEKRLSDASPFDSIRFDPEWQQRLMGFFATSDGAAFVEAVNKTDELIDGFQSPLGMEILATVDWLLARQQAEPTVAGIRRALDQWPAGTEAARRKQKLFTDRLIVAALGRLDYLREEAAKGRREDFEGYLAAVPDRQSIETDRMPE
jgi:O-acetyl-ADP-ribose deacetylase (regulator of RNase III)